MKKKVLLAGKILISVTLMTFIIIKSFDSFNISSINLPPFSGILTAFLFSLLCEMLASQRTRLIILATGERISTSFSLWMQTVGLFFNMGVPGMMGGDAVKLYALNRRGLPWHQGMTALLMDRVLGFIVLVGLAGLTSLTVFSLSGNQAWITPLLVGSALCLAVGLVSLLALPALIRLLPSSCQSWRLVTLLGNIGEGARMMRHRPGAIILASAIAIIMQLSQAGAVFMLLKAVGETPDYLAVLMATSIAVLVGTLPVSFGGFGVREGILVNILIAFGIPDNSAAVSSILFGGFVLTLALPGGLVWLISKPATRTEGEMPPGQPAP